MPFSSLNQLQVMPFSSIVMPLIKYKQCPKPTNKCYYSDILQQTRQTPMLKIKSKSLVINEPMPAEVKEHVALLIERQEEHMRLKKEKDTEKEARLDAIQRDFVEWADRKESLIRNKISKSVQKKEDHLNKIVKKCKDHERFLNEKYKNYQNKKKASIKEAWRKAGQLTNNIENYNESLHLARDMGLSRERNDLNVAESRFVDKLSAPQDKDDSKQYIPNSYNNPSKYVSNPSKDYWGELNQSLRQKHVTETLPALEENKQPKSKEEHNGKLKETIARFKQQMKECEEDRVQKLGESLRRIEKSRTKKIEIRKKKREDKEEREAFIETEYHEKPPKKAKDHRSQRIHSQTIMRQKRVQDWSELNRINRLKRQQYMQVHLQNGTEYLASQKIKYIKTNLAKKINISAVQKKLYFQRLNH